MSTPPPTRRRRMLLAILFVVPLVPLGLFGWGALAPRPAGLGVRDGHLAPCPASPNCVATEASDAAHLLPPLRFTDGPEAAKRRLLAVVAAMPRTRLVTDSGDYLHFEFTSALFRFVDDVEFLVRPESGTIEFRSASRIGWSDLGANRRRMESIRAAFDRTAT